MGFENSSNINYSAGIKPGMKIDLSKFDKAPKAPKPETYLPVLDKLSGKQAERLQAEYGDFFTPEAQVKMIGPDAQADLDLIAAKESGWAHDAGKTVEQLASDREKNPASIAEVAATLLFDKVLKDDFIIVRASVYDDYENGADQIIIDKKTGAVICGLDDVVGHLGDDGGEKKKGKIDRKMEKGGASIKYGLTMEGNKLAQRSLRHIPIFYFSLSKEELDGLLKSLAAEDDSQSAIENKTYAKLVNSLSAQVAEYSANSSLHPQLKNNLHNFAPSLSKMQSRIVTI